MKGFSKKLICLIMGALLMLLPIGCAKDNDDNAETTVASTEATTTAATAPVPVTVSEKYMPDGLIDKISASMSITSVMAQGSAPYASQNVGAIGGGRLTSITIPIFKTLVADSNGDFSLTLSVFGTSGNGMKSEAKRQYIVKINQNEHSLALGTVRKLVTIDVSGYDIVLGDDETLAFYSKGDTVIPAYLTGSGLSSEIASEFPNISGIFHSVGTENLTTIDGALIFDFTFERTYESQAAYDAKLAADNEYASIVESLKAKYAGKKVSILGDSISTYQGVSNNTSYNSTIGSNAIYYRSDRLPSPDNTYWGRLIKDTGMTLCVNNSYSGSKVYETDVASSAVHRANQLHNNSGEKPDVVLVYLGTNDLNGSASLGSLTSSLTSGEGQHDKVDAWWQGVMTATSNGTNITVGTTYKTFDEGYALILYQIKQAYPDAEIICMTPFPNNRTNFSAVRLKSLNNCVEALSEYFGATYLNLSDATGINYNNCKYFMRDVPNAFHPTAYGHFRMTLAIAKLLDEK
ncbi:MAG: hypothetical protein IJ038_07295 [Clostridia bacterium]|nr:hypothetical protein [Clostridia bacterium]